MGHSMGHLYRMGHPDGTSLVTVWDIYIYSMGHISIQYGTSIHSVWDISLCSM